MASKLPRIKQQGLTAAEQATYAQLQEVRRSKTVALHPNPLVRTTIARNGEELPFQLRYYQVQGVCHMVVLPRMVLGDDTGLGKTVETIVALCHMLSKDPSLKPIIVTSKSSQLQWVGEIERFTVGIRPILAGDPRYRRGKESPVEARKRAYHDWETSKDLTILITGYGTMIRDWNHEGFQPPEAGGKTAKEAVKPGLLDAITARLAPRLVAIFDEAQNMRERTTKTHEIGTFLSHRARRSYGLTATMLENDLMDGYNVMRVIKPGLFPQPTPFMEEYCNFQLKSAPSGRGKIPIVTGYKNLEKFRNVIDPFFLGRKKEAVSDELPKIRSKEVPCTLSDLEDSKYEEAVMGVLELGDGTVKDFEEHRALVSLLYTQRVVDSLALLKFDESTEFPGYDFDNWVPTKTKLDKETFSKEEALLSLLQEELSGKKVIVYTKFSGVVDRLQQVLKKARIGSVRITGADNAKSRQASQDEFQDMRSETKIIFITAAGGTALNLQSAEAMIFYDMPWSYGAFLQALGRMVRIGSAYISVMVYHILALRADGRKTIDHYTLELVQKKKKLIDQILGVAGEGSLTFEDDDNMTKALVKMLKAGK